MKIKILTIICLTIATTIIAADDWKLFSEYRLDSLGENKIEI